MDEESKKNVLIIDDDPAIRKVVGMSLSRSGFHTSGAEDGVQALELLEKQPRPDCILLDIRMPRMSGKDVLVKVKRKYPLIPVIMLSALTDLETAVDTMRKGAFDYIVKPVRKIHLVETVKKAIRYREMMLENQRLARENEEYQKSLEKKVEERTRELFQAYKKLKETNLETVKILAETIEAKDPYTRGHCNRVRILSSRIAQFTDMDHSSIETLEYGALLHDIGKIGISETLLHKNGKLTFEERNCFQMHPIIGENILKTVDFFKPCLKIIRNHHERFNGQGYPDSLEGDAIELGARIVAISDAFDAMTSTRPYRKALSVDFALSELENGKHTQFDPWLVDIFMENEIYTRITTSQGKVAEKI
ncbi:MAG: HD domain-containing phosphohydrolase [Spirochaetota bacterium]